MQTYFTWQGLSVFTEKEHGEIAAFLQAAKDAFAQEANSSPVNLSYTVLDQELEYAKARCKILLDRCLQATPGKEFRPESLCEELWKIWSLVARDMAEVQSEMENTSEARRKKR